MNTQPSSSNISSVLFEKYNALLLEAYKQIRERPASEYIDWLFDLLQEAIPHDAWFWGTGCQLDGEIITHSVLLKNVPMEMMSVWEKYKHLDVMSAQLVLNPNKVFNRDYAELSSHEIYPLLYEPSQIRQFIAAYWYTPKSGLHNGLSLYRSDSGYPFTEEERLLFENLIPHFIELRFRNSLESDEILSLRLAGHDGFAICDRLGVIHSLDTVFVTQLSAEWPEWVGPRLPDPITKAIKGNASIWLGKTIRVKVKRLRDMFLLQVRPRALVDDLTEREILVARLFVRGLNHKEVAREFNLSPATIRNHLSNIYLKLKISDKAALATLLAASGLGEPI